jgi:type II secretory pathway pseudopilin PulG
MAGPHCRIRCRHKGGILLEILLAIALFAGAAAFVLGSLRSSFASLERARQLQQAVDLARSRMAELEAGLINLSELRGDSVSSTGSLGGDVHENDKLAAETGPADQWLFDVKTHRTEFAGLSLVELTIRENVPSHLQASSVQFTLRQLIPLREGDAIEYEADEISQEGGDDIHS